METSANPQGNTTAPRRLLALARDPQLCQALQDMGDAAPLHLSEDLGALTDELMKQGAAIVLLDAAALDSPLEAVVDALNAQFPDLLLMVAGNGAEQNLLATRISEQAVFRFVHKPASQQRLRLFMDAAARAAPRREALPAAGAPTTRQTRATPLPGAAPPSGTGFKFSSFHIGIVALVLAVVTAWLLWPQPPAPPPPAAPVVDPAREQARVVEQALSTAEAALLSGNLQEAAAATEQARALQPDNSRVAFLVAQLEREQTRAAIDAAQQQAEDTSETQLRSALARMSERLRGGQLLEPLDDSAAAHFRDARRIAPEDPAVLIARDALVAAMLTAADQNLVAGRTSEARQLADVTARLHPNAPGLDVVRRRINETLAAQAAAASAAAQPAAPPSAPPAATAASSAVQAPVPEPTPATAAEVPANPPAAIPRPVPAAPAAAPAAVSAGTLKVLRRVEPKYPERAWEQQVSGWVEMEFTVAADGSTRDIRVTASEPSRTFDSAAVSALRRYRYEPVVRNGSPVELRARMRIRFTAQGKD